MNILTGLPIGAKIVGGIVTAVTAVAVPTVIIINNSNANKPPETPQAHMVQQVKPEEPTEEVTIIENDNEEESKATKEPVKAESVAPVKTEQPAPNPTPAPAPTPTREELFARAVAEFKTIAVSGDGKVTGKDFLDRMRSSYLSIINQGDTDEKWAKRRLESLYPVYPMPTWLPLSMQFAKILQKHGLIDANLAEENFTIQARNVAYPYLIDLAISGNY